MDIRYAFAGIVVSDRDSAMAWYQAVFGRPADLLPNQREAMWQVSAEASVYLLADPDRAGRSSTTMVVGDLDGELTALAARGIEAGQVEVIEGAGRKAVLVDPDGNEVSIVELLVAVN